MPDMNAAYFCITPQGEAIAQRLAAHFGGICYGKSQLESQLPICFQSCRLLVFLTAAGIAVRLLAPLLQSKKTDPAVLVISQDGRYVISLLSGHMGGANAYARAVAAYLHAQPVITTATDTAGLVAFDALAQEMGWAVNDLSFCKPVAAKMLRAEKALVYSDVGLPPCPGTMPCASRREADVVISPFQSPDEQPIHGQLQLFPRVVAVGIGCKRNTAPLQLEAAYDDFLNQFHLAEQSIFTLATIEEKEHEPAIAWLAQRKNLPVQIISKDEIRACADRFERSAFVEQTVHVPAVAEPCSYIAAKRGTMLTKKIRCAGITLAACMMHMIWTTQGKDLI